MSLQSFLKGQYIQETPEQIREEQNTFEDCNQQQPDYKDQDEELSLSQDSYHQKKKKSSKISSIKGSKKINCAWTLRKLQLAKKLFPKHFANSNMITMKRVCRILNLSPYHVKRAMEVYKEDNTMESIRQQTQQYLETTPTFYMYCFNKVKEYLAENPTLLFEQIQQYLSEDFIRQEQSFTEFNLGLFKISNIVRKAGYQKVRIKYQSKKDINSDKNIDERFQFSKYYKILDNYDFPLYYYSQYNFLQPKKNRKHGWAKAGEQLISPELIGRKKLIVSCLADPEGIISWNIRLGKFHKYVFDGLIYKLIQNGGIFNKKARKLILIDKSYIQAPELFTKIADLYNFDIVNLLPHDVMPNPLDNWYHDIINKLRFISCRTQRQYEKALFGLLDKKCFDTALTSLQYFLEVVQQSLLKQPI